MGPPASRTQGGILCCLGTCTVALYLAAVVLWDRGDAQRARPCVLATGRVLPSRPFRTPSTLVFSATVLFALVMPGVHSVVNV